MQDTEESSEEESDEEEEAAAQVGLAFCDGFFCISHVILAFTGSERSHFHPSCLL